MQFTKNTSSGKSATGLIVKLGLVLILFIGAIFLLSELENLFYLKEKLLQGIKLKQYLIL